MRIQAVRRGPRVRRFVVLTVACAAALLAGAVGSASAAYTASVTNQTLTVTGDGASDKLALRLNAADPTTLQVDVGEDGSAEFSFPLSSFTSIHVSAGGGNDEVLVDESSGTFSDKTLTIDGGPGSDRLFGGSGNDVLIGGSGNDLILGRRGNDVALMGDGNDTSAWNPGDGSDVIEGQAGADLLQFNGANVNERLDMSANGSRVRLTRDVANIVMDLNGVEQVQAAALGGTDNVAVHDLTGTDLRTVNVDLSSPPGSGTGDGAADTVAADGTPGTDTATLGPIPGGTALTGLFTRVNVRGGETADTLKFQGLGGNDKLNTRIGVLSPGTTAFDGGDGTDSANYAGSSAPDTINIAPDATATGVLTTAGGAAGFDTTAVESLTVNGGVGGDTISGSNGLAGRTNLTLIGGDGNDILLGGDGADVLNGGAGDDTVLGQRGNDVAFLGDGNDTFAWNPGDSSDTVDGQGGTDLLQFNGANIAEKIGLAPNGSRVLLTRDVASVTLDVTGMDRSRIVALGGADLITVNDLSGTDMRAVAVDLSGTPGGGGDLQPDTVTVNGTSKADYLSVTPAGNNVLTFGLFAPVQIAGSESDRDTLAINTLGGTDSVAVDSGVGSLIKTAIDLGPQ